MKRKQAQSLDSVGGDESRELAPADEQTLEEEDADDLEEDDAFGICFTTTESKCEELYERGVLLKSQGQLETALTCFVESLKRMQECQYFAKLPHTLHELAELYHAMERYDKAVEFAQAEKLFYEAVLVDRHGTKRERKSRHAYATADGSSDPADYGDLLVKKASEFEELSRLCARDNKFELALDYCGKAAKIRQSVFGQEHPSTVATLEYFTELYAEVGRQQYSAAMHRMSSERGGAENLTCLVNPKPELSLKVDEESSTSVEEETSDTTIEEDRWKLIPQDGGENSKMAKENCQQSVSIPNPTPAEEYVDTAVSPPCANRESQMDPVGDRGPKSVIEQATQQLGYYGPLWLILVAAVVFIALTFA